MIQRTLAENHKKKPTYDKETARYSEEGLHFIQHLLQREVDNTYADGFNNHTHLSLLHLQQKGTWKCGFNNISSMDKQADCFPIYHDDNPFVPSSCDTDSRGHCPQFLRITKMNLVEVMLQRTTRKHTSSSKTGDSADSSDTNIGNRVVIDIEANGTPESIHLWAKQVFKDDNGDDDLEQQRAFEILAAKFVLTYFSEADTNNDNNDTLSGTARSEYLRCKRLLTEIVGRPAEKGQLIMFLTGPGGSGKSAIVKQLLQYAQLFCSNIKQPFTRRTILVTACSGVAATLIHGQTLHSATFLNWKEKNIDLDDKAKFQNCVKLMIVDEISLLGGSDISNLSKRMNWLADNQSGVFGGKDIAFMGDFRQLTPIGKKAIYESKCVEFRSFVNCYIALQGQYRFRKDRAFGELCSRFHSGCPTIGDFVTLNNRLVSPLNPVPKNVRTGCKRNDEREAVNVGTWIQYLKDHGDDHGFVILADNVHIRREGSRDTRLQDLATFYTRVGEDNCDTHMEGRFTPML